MTEWLQQVSPLTLKGQIKVPYKWSVGTVGSRFLTNIRDNGRLLANRCPKCGRVFVPPRANCGSCFVAIGEENWLEVGCQGTVTSFTVVSDHHAVRPVNSDFAYALIRLDGADTAICHLITEDLEKIKIGSRVEAVFRSERHGDIRDIEAFKLIEEKTNG